MIDLIFWWVGGVVCAAGAIGATAVIVICCIEAVLDATGRGKRIIDALIEIRRHQEDRRKA